MKIVGLTGSIGTGKSSVSSILKEEFGLSIIDADEISRKAVAKGSEGLHKIAEAFGNEYIGEDGELDRKKMADLVFSNEEKRRMLNDIVHPQVKKEFYDSVEEYSKRGEKVVIFDCPLLIEEKMTDMVNLVMLVCTSEKVQIERIKARDNITEEEAKARIASQMSQDVKKTFADIIIENNGTLEELKKEVKNAYLNKIISV